MLRGEPNTVLNCSQAASNKATADRLTEQPQRPTQRTQRSHKSSHTRISNEPQTSEFAEILKRNERTIAKIARANSMRKLTHTIKFDTPLTKTQTTQNAKSKVELTQYLPLPHHYDEQKRKLSGGTTCGGAVVRNRMNSYKQNRCYSEAFKATVRIYFGNSTPIHWHWHFPNLSIYTLYVHYKYIHIYMYICIYKVIFLCIQLSDCPERSGVQQFIYLHTLYLFIYLFIIIFCLQRGCPAGHWGAYADILYVCMYVCRWARCRSTSIRCRIIIEIIDFWTSRQEGARKSQEMHTDTHSYRINQWRRAELNCLYV